MTFLKKGKKKRETEVIASLRKGKKKKDSKKSFFNLFITCIQPKVGTRID